MSVNQMTIYHTIIWKYLLYLLYNYSSEQINNKYRHHDRHSLRRNTNNFLRVPEILLRRKCTGFTYCGAKIFNNLPNNIRETQDSIIFKKLVKNWIWDEVPSSRHAPLQVELGLEPAWLELITTKLHLIKKNPIFTEYTCSI